MSLASLAQPKNTGLKGLAGLANKGSNASQKIDLSSQEGLVQKAQEADLGKDAEKIIDEKPKLSFLQRLGKGLGAFNTANAVNTGLEKGLGQGIIQYGKDIISGLGSAITGNDYESERKSYADIAQKIGIENGIAKFGIGFAGDVLLDPTTYFGGTLVKGLTLGTKNATNIALKGIGKVVPETEAGLRLAAKGLKDAIGRAFEYGYKASKGAKEDILTFLSKEQKAKLGLASSNLDRLGTGVLTEAQREELALKMIAGKRAEFAVRESGGMILRETGEKLDENVADAVYNTAMEMDVAQAGERVFDDFGNVRGVPSTFPKWIPENLRSRKLFNSFDQKLVNKVPFSGKELELFDAVKNRVSELSGIAAEDINPATLRGVKEEFVSGNIIGREAAKSSDPVVQKVIESQIERSQKFSKGITENPYEVYFPFIKKDKVQKFLSETSGIRVGSEGYRKQFRNLLTNENLELDPAKAFFTRESQVVSDKMTRDFLSGFVKKYGKTLDEFKNVDEATKAGYQLIKEKGIFGKELGYVSKYDGALIKDSISPEFQTVNMLAKATGFDALTSLFKRSVTGLFAPFHIRNFASGMIQNFEILGKDALNPKNIAVGQKIAYMMGKGEKIPSSLEKIWKPFVDRFSGDTFYNADFDIALKNGSELKQLSGAFSGSALKKTLGLQKGNIIPIVGQDATPMKIGRAIGQFIEHQQKATAYATALGQGKSIPEALKLAEAAGFDYRALTRFESQIMRRIIPFYSFTRKNIELQLKTLSENPQRINQVLKFFGNIGQANGGSITEEEKRNLPDFIKESIGVKLKDTPDGLKQYISSFGTPIEAFTQLFGSNPILRTISTFNPILKVPIELGIGKDSFRQRDLKDVYSANEYKLAPQIIKDLLDIKEVKKPIYKTVNGKAKIVGEKIAYIADPERLLVARSLFTSRGVSYIDQVFGNDMKGFIKLLKTTTGIKPQQVDIEAQKYFNQRDKQRALEDLLIRHGVVKQFSKTYIPKKN